ncbi:MAG: class I SAM-dependent methyltransferase, partial [Actinomycetota bacterium]
MPDLSFRDELYGRYVSTFKASDYSKLDGKALRSYFAWCDYKYLPLLERCDRRVPVLELGCGGGLTMDYLKRVGFTSVEGIDISQEQIEVARARGLDVTAADVFEYVDPRQETYGAIVALDFIEHFTKDEVLRLLTSVYRALKDGGT